MPSGVWPPTLSPPASGSAPCTAGGTAAALPPLPPHHHQRQRSQPQLSPHGSGHPTLQRQHSQPQQHLEDATASLFETPPDLVCPITHEVFVDPAINAAGQVYERAAISRCLADAAGAGALLRDPVTNAPLASPQLLPVYPMRSRAAEFREDTARRCVAAALDAAQPDPVRLLRRAAELVHPDACVLPASGAPPGAAGGLAQRSGSALQAPPPPAVPGISRGLARFLASHRGPAYDALALKYFGQELAAGGWEERAADVFCRLLVGAEDRQLQVEYLQMCLDCWTAQTSSDRSTAACGASNSHSKAAAAEHGCGFSCALGQGQAGGATCGGAGSHADSCGGGADGNGDGCRMDDALLAKVADFVEQRTGGLAVGAVLDMLADSRRLGRAALLQLCDELLQRSAPALSDGAVPVNGPAERAQRSQADLVEVLVRYVRLSCACSSARTSALQRQLQLSGVLSQHAAAAASTQQSQGSGATAAPQPPDERQAPVNRRPRWQGVLGCKVARVAATGLLAVASLLGGEHPALRVARTAPLLLLLSCRGGGEGGVRGP